jgi:hypothetical protein
MQHSSSSRSSSSMAMHVSAVACASLWCRGLS